MRWLRADQAKILYSKIYNINNNKKKNNNNKKNNSDINNNLEIRSKGVDNMISFLHIVL